MPTLFELFYFVKKTTSTEYYQDIARFEASFNDLLASMGPRMKCEKLSYQTERTATDALQDILKPELWPLCFSVVAIAVLAFIVIRFTSTNAGYLRTVFLMFSSLAFPLTCSAGVVSITNSTFSSTYLFIPFLLLGKATTDVVLYLMEWERQKKVPSLEHRVGNCLARTGVLAVMTALYGSVLYGLGIKSSFNAISNFSFATLVAYVTFSASILITVTVLMYFERKLKKVNTPRATTCERRLSICEVGRIELRLLRCHKTKLQRTLKELAWKITSTSGKILSLGIFALLITLVVFSAFQTGDRTRTTQLRYRSENFKQFNKARQMFLDNETDVSIVFSKQVDYSLKSVQNQVLSMCKKLEEAAYSKEKSLCWMAGFLKWVKH